MVFNTEPAEFRDVMNIQTTSGLLPVCLFCYTAILTHATISFKRFAALFRPTGAVVPDMPAIPSR
jgi:hypothetical protein